MKEHHVKRAIAPAIFGAGIAPPVPTGKWIGRTADNLWKGKHNIVGQSPGQVSALLDERRAELNGGLGTAVQNQMGCTGLFSAEFFWPMGSGEGYGRVSYSYTDDIKTMNLTPSVGDQEAYGVLNASLAYSMQNSRWRFALNGHNLTDEKFLQAGYDFGAAINYISQLGFYGAPRTYSISATFTY